MARTFILSEPCERIIDTSIAKPTLASHALMDKRIMEYRNVELVEKASTIVCIIILSISVSKLKRTIRR